MGCKVRREAGGLGSYEAAKLSREVPCRAELMEQGLGCGSFSSAQELLVVVGGQKGQGIISGHNTTN